MCEITSATITKVQNVIFWGGEGVRKAEKQVCQLATLGIKGLSGVVAPSPPVCATAYTVGALTAWKHNAQPTDEPLKCYNEATDSNIKNHWSTVRSHQIVKHNPYFRF